MSKELDGQIPELEEEIASLQDSYIVVTLLCRSPEDVNPQIFSGSLSGISIEDVATKLDAAVNIATAHSVLSKIAKGNFFCETVYLVHGTDETCLAGPYAFKSVRILEIDRETKMCVLGVDLVRFEHN